MLYIIIAVALVAFLIILSVIYFDNIKNYLKNKFKKSKKQEPEKKEEKKPEVKVEEFIPLKNQYDDNVRDESLEALLSSPDVYNEADTMVNDDGQRLFMGDVVSKSDTPKANQLLDNNLDFDKMFNGQFASNSKTNKSIAEQIKDLSPELKAILIDSLLKKRDDV